MSKNFTATRAGVAIAVTTQSNPTQLDGIAVMAGAAVDAMLDNRGNADCYFLFGGPGLSVDKNTGVRLMAGTTLIFGKGSATHIAVIGDGATSVVVHLGEGS